MKRTSICFQRGTSNTKAAAIWKRLESEPHLLPSPGIFSLAWSCLGGLIAHWTEASARDAYGQYVKDGILRDQVLAGASWGSIRTMALFYNLQNPLWKQHADTFNIREFVDYVPRALEIYTDTLGRLALELQNDKAREQQEESSTSTSDTTATTAPNPNMDPTKVDFPNVFSLNLTNLDDHPWMQMAKKDPDSLAGRISRMTTKRLFHDHFVGAELYHFVNIARQQSGLSVVSYVPGTSIVQQWALVSAQVDHVVLDDSDDVDTDDEEEASSTENVPWTGVAARLDVLYELQQTYRRQNEPPTESQMNDSTTTNSITTATEAIGSGGGGADTGADTAAAANVAHVGGGGVVNGEMVQNDESAPSLTEKNSKDLPLPVATETIVADSSLVNHTKKIDIATGEEHINQAIVDIPPSDNIAKDNTRTNDDTSLLETDNSSSSAPLANTSSQLETTAASTASTPPVPANNNNIKHDTLNDESSTDRTPDTSGSDLKESESFQPETKNNIDVPKPSLTKDSTPQEIVVTSNMLSQTSTPTPPLQSPRSIVAPRSDTSTATTTDDSTRTNDDNHGAGEEHKDDDDDDDRTFTETSFVVASFEGWLHGGPGELRWKISKVRDAHEFF